MNYYSLEKYYKKSETKSQPSISKSIEALISPKHELKRPLATENDQILESPLDENKSLDTTVYKNLFKRLQSVSPDLTEAFELVFSYQFGLNNIMLELVKTYERLLSDVLDSNKSLPVGPKKQKTALHQPKPSKTPLEIEINSIVHDVEKSRQEIHTLLTEILPKKQTNISKNQKSRISDILSETRRTPVKRSKSSLRVDRLSNQFQPSLKKSSSFLRSSSRRDTQISNKRDSKENTNLISVNNLLRCSSPFREKKPNSPISIQSLTLPDYPLTRKNFNPFETQDYLFPDTKKKNFLTCLTESVQTLPSEIGSPTRGPSKHASIGEQISMKYIREVEDLECSSLSTLGRTIEDAPNSQSPRIEPEDLYLRSPTIKTKEDLVIQAKKEKNIIKQLLKIQNNSPSPAQASQPKGFCYSAQARYLIEAKWWIAWKEYVNFDCNEFENKTLKQFYQRPGMIMNKQLIQDDSGKGDNTGQLREDILEHHDFVAVSKDVFETLANNYGCDYQIIRLLKPDPTHPNKMYLDLFPTQQFLDRALPSKMIAPKKIL